MSSVGAGAAHAFAHHSFAMFEMDKDVTYKGVVTEFKWISPHVHLTIEIKPGPGVDPATVGIWDVEGGSTNIMGRQGWNRRDLQAGRCDHAGRPPDEGRLEGDLALLRRSCPTASGCTTTSRAQGRSGTAVISRRDFGRTALAGVGWSLPAPIGAAAQR